jgi:hypothetical protein
VGTFLHPCPQKMYKDAIYAMLNLALTLGSKRDELRAEPEMENISAAIAGQFQCPRPEIQVMKYHAISAVFSYQSKASLYLRAVGSSLPTDDKIPDQVALQQIVDGLASKLKGRDRYFDTKQHLSAKFQRGVIGGSVFATFEKGAWEHTPAPEFKSSISITS